MLTLALAQTKFPNNGDIPSLIRDLCSEAAASDAKMIIFPEGITVPPEADVEQLASLAQPLDGNICTQFAEMARQNALWIIACVNEKNDFGRPFNTAAIFDSDGALRGAYRKTHLYAAHSEDESLRMSAGDRLLDPIETPFCTLGLGICYDVRFPEIARTAALGGCNVMVYPAAWVDGPNKALHWETLLRARAIENEMFVAGCCRVDGKSVGTSFVFDPLGNEISHPSTKMSRGLLLADIDVGLAALARENMPIFSHRRPELYRIDARIDKAKG